MLWFRNFYFLKWSPVNQSKCCVTFQIHKGSSVGTSSLWLQTCWLRFTNEWNIDKPTASPSRDSNDCLYSWQTEKWATSGQRFHPVAGARAWVWKRCCKVFGPDERETWGYLHSEFWWRSPRGKLIYKNDNIQRIEELFWVWWQWQLDGQTD